MEIRTLYTLLAIADHGSFAAAGRALGLSVSGVSLQMRGLEEETGLTLFDRSRRPPEITEAGRALVGRARGVIERWEALAESLRRPGDAGLLRIGAVHTAVSGLLPEALLGLRARMPELTLRLTTGLTHDLESALRLGRIDVAICTEPESVPAELTFRAFATERLVVLAPARAEGETAAELLTRNPYVRFNPQARVAAIVEAALGRLGLAPGTAMEIDTLEGVISLVAHGLGVSVVPEPFERRDGDVRLRMLALGEPPATRRLGTLAPSDTLRRRFIDALHACLAEAAARGSGPSDRALPAARAGG